MNEKFTWWDEVWLPLLGAILFNSWWIVPMGVVAGIVFWILGFF